MKSIASILSAAALAAAFSQVFGGALPRLRVSDDGHFLATEEQRHAKSGAIVVAFFKN